MKKVLRILSVLLAIVLCAALFYILNVSALFYSALPVTEPETLCGIVDGIDREELLSNFDFSSLYEEADAKLTGYGLSLDRSFYGPYVTETIEDAVEMYLEDVKSVIRQGDSADMRFSQENISALLHERLTVLVENIDFTDQIVSLLKKQITDRFPNLGSLAVDFVLKQLVKNNPETVKKIDEDCRNAALNELAGICDGLAEEALNNIPDAKELAGKYEARIETEKLRISVGKKLYPIAILLAVVVIFVLRRRKADGLLWNAVPFLLTGASQLWVLRKVTGDAVLQRITDKYLAPYRLDSALKPALKLFAGTERQLALLASAVGFLLLLLFVIFRLRRSRRSKLETETGA